ncbi:MAG: rRNA maturation RNase YbeY [Candidatus Atribacteria bacterium]|nr:rRNA maturation RNase YbeY [Candidatus Atribacteria bacterium]
MEKMIDIHVRKPFVKYVSKKEIRNSLIQVISSLFPEKKFEFGVLICSDAEIKKLNQQYRQVNSATDVLSFQSEEVIPYLEMDYLGDIVISYETAFVQAQKIGHSVSSEILILLIHGLLHLLGFDHDTEKNKLIMWQKQYEALKILDLQVKGFSGEDD